jgi:hypothetical protein
MLRGQSEHGNVYSPIPRSLSVGVGVGFGFGFGVGVDLGVTLGLCQRRSTLLWVSLIIHLNIPTFICIGGGVCCKCSTLLISRGLATSAVLRAH